MISIPFVRTFVFSFTPHVAKMDNLFYWKARDETVNASSNAREILKVKIVRKLHL